MMMDIEPRVLPDPRTDTWAVKPASEPTLQAYLTQALAECFRQLPRAGKLESARKSPHPQAAISKALPKLASASERQVRRSFPVAERERRVADRERVPNDEGALARRIRGI